MNLYDTNEAFGVPTYRSPSSRASVGKPIADVDVVVGNLGLKKLSFVTVCQNSVRDVTCNCIVTNTDKIGIHMRVSRIQLKNWKNFQEVDVKLTPRTFLLGVNAAGKSNFLDAFRFI